MTCNRCISPMCLCSVAQSCPALGDLLNCSPPGSSERGIFQARTLRWIAISSTRGSSWPRNWTHVSWVFCIAGRFFTAEASGKPLLAPCSSTKYERKCSCSFVSDSLWPMDQSPPGSSVHEILQEKILEWVAIPFSRGSSWLRDPTWFSRIADKCFLIWSTRDFI